MEIESYESQQAILKDIKRQAKADAAAANAAPTGPQLIQMVSAPKTAPGDMINLNKVVDLTKNREVPVISKDMFQQCIELYASLNWAKSPNRTGDHRSNNSRG